MWLTPDSGSLRRSPSSRRRRSGLAAPEARQAASGLAFDQRLEGLLNQSGFVFYAGECLGFGHQLVIQR
jgi:hypothetical protein